MDAWIPITIAAAFLQNLRFMLQKHLKATRLSTAGATFARFAYGAPAAALAVAGLAVASGEPLPGTNARFWAMALTGGLAQILATVCVVALFAARNFAVGIALKKTETVQTAILGLVVLGEAVAPGALVAILVGLVGVLLLSDPPGRAPGAGWRGRVFNRAAGLGLASGALFGVSAIGYRGAALALEDGGVLIRAAVTLAAVTAAQALAMALWLGWREAGEAGRVFRHWRVTLPAGLASVAGSLCWFTAFTLQSPAYVKALGQVELVFTFLASWLVFRERSTRREVAGVVLVVASILILVLAAA
jgi:drug/metabolite transporter (DMT)-like permease